MARNIKRNVLTANKEELAGLEGAGEGMSWRTLSEDADAWIKQGSRWKTKKQNASSSTRDYRGDIGKEPEYWDQGSLAHASRESRSRDFRKESSEFNGEKRGGNIGTSILIGLAGGLAATFAMTQAQRAVQKAQKGNQPEPPRSEEEKQKEINEQSTVKLADKVSRSVADREIPQEQKQIAGNAVHYTFGTLMGGAYGALASTLDDAPLGTGVLFGVGLWLAADEFVLPQLGLSKPPRERDLKEHAYEASAHALYGLCLDATNQLRKRIA
jgi:uncharacterized membrane protein YagU involved in acid resistance